MTHPDPRTAEIQQRNQRAYSEAVDAPPPEVADDLAAFFRWKRDTPRRTTATPRRREYLDYKRPDRPVPPAQPERDPAYHQAAALLLRLPDLGHSAIEEARTDLGQDTPYERLVIRAAETIAAAPHPHLTRHTRRTP